MLQPQDCTPRGGLPRHPIPALALALALIAALAACSGDKAGAGPEVDPTRSAAVEREGPPPLETTAAIGEVVGKLNAAHQKRLVTKVRGVVDAWIDAAYVAGDYPRSDFADAFPGFSDGAVADATADAGLMSNAGIGARVEAVTATKRDLVVDALAVKGRAVAVTARVVLAFQVEGDLARKERVRGRLFMTYRDGGWQIFGYDVNRGLGR